MRWICAGFVAASLLALGCSDDSNGTGKGGSGGAAGLGGSGGGAAGQGGFPAAAATFAFTTDVEGFVLDTFANPGPYTDGNPQNVGGVPNGAATPLVEFDDNTGMPAAGSLRIKVTFNYFNQTITVRRAYTPSTTVNLTGKTVTAQIKLDSGTFSGIVHLMALSSPTPTGPGYYFGQGASLHLDDHEWHTLTFTMASPEFAATGFDPGDIVQLGVQLASGILAVPPPVTGSAGAGGGAGGTGGGAAGGSGGAGGDGGSAPGGAGGASSGAGGAGGPSGPPYGSPQSISIHFDTVGWN